MAMNTFQPKTISMDQKRKLAEIVHKHIQKASRYSLFDPALERSVLELLQSPTQVEELSRKLRMPRAQVQASIQRLMDMDLVHAVIPRTAATPLAGQAYYILNIRPVLQDALEIEQQFQSNPDRIDQLQGFLKEHDSDISIADRILVIKEVLRIYKMEWALKNPANPDKQKLQNLISLYELRLEIEEREYAHQVTGQEFVTAEQKEKIRPSRYLALSRRNINVTFKLKGVTLTKNYFVPKFSISHESDFDNFCDQFQLFNVIFVGINYEEYRGQLVPLVEVLFHLSRHPQFRVQIFYNLLDLDSFSEAELRAVQKLSFSAEDYRKKPGLPKNPRERIELLRWPR